MPRLSLIAAAVFGLAAASYAEDPAEPVHFETHVRSIFKKHCFQCHGEEEHHEGELDLRLVRLMMSGGDSGAAIVPGKSDESVLFQRLRDGEMPPDESKLLSAEELETVRKWIDSGATTLRPEPDTINEAAFITEEERAHWSYQPIVKPAVPSVSHTDSVSNPIDAFLLKRLEEKNFTFSARATPEKLIRRLHMDLHGLPPSPEDVADFAANPDGDAWQAAVARLLDSHHYGERWARHWLDVCGYADSEGYNDVDAVRPHAWRFRDYVIRSFNSDKPFDRFIHEQLAGDELVTSPRNNISETDTELYAATGFLRMAPDGTGGAVPDANVARNATIADTISIVSSSLMGMTVGCAQCHDHRYDPISQADYYRFRAIFEPAFDWKKWRKPTQRRISLYTDEDRAAAAKVEVDAKVIDAERSKQQAEFIKATFEKQLAKLPAEVHELARATHAAKPADRTDEQKALFKKHPSLNVTSGSLYLYDKKAADKLKALSAKAKKKRAEKPEEQFVRALTEVKGRVPPTNLFFRGDHEQPKQELSPAGLTVVSETSEVSDVPAASEKTPTSGRRLAFARRLTHANHPLTARTIVNRIWLHHFGRGLVTTPSDFGQLGQKPSHPELLNWLASEFIDSGWSLKHIHRLILTSTAWQQQLRSNIDHDRVDPDNELYGGSRLVRLDAEIVRDTILAICGKLNTKTFGAPVPVMADRVGRFVIGKENLNAGRPGAVVDMKTEQFRRSIYVQVRRSRPLSMMDAFDRPVMTPNCDMRRPSTSSTQSLLMMNSDQLIDYSRFLAKRLERDAPADVMAQIFLLWRLAYARSPEHSELESARQFVADQTKIFNEQAAYKPTKDKAPPRTAAHEALAVLCQMLLSSNEFLYID